MLLHLVLLQCSSWRRPRSTVRGWRFDEYQGVRGESPHMHLLSTVRSRMACDQHLAISAVYPITGRQDHSRTLLQMEFRCAKAVLA